MTPRPSPQRTMKPRLALAVALALSLPLAGCGSPSGSGVDLEETVTLAPGAFAEVNLQMDEGDRVAWDWSVVEGAAVHFNVHTHAGGQAQELQSEEAASGQGSFTAPASGIYSLLWESHGAEPLTLRYKVTGEGSVDSTLP